MVSIFCSGLCVQIKGIYLWKGQSILETICVCVFSYKHTTCTDWEYLFKSNLSYCSSFSLFLFHFAGCSGIALCCPTRKEVGVRKCLFFWDQQELASSQAVPFFAAGTMHWRHTPRLDLGISHGKMFPEFRSQARGKAEDGVRVRGREVEGGG